MLKSLITEWNAEGVVCTDKSGALRATIAHSRRDSTSFWTVTFPHDDNQEHAKEFRSLNAAEFYALAMAIEFDLLVAIAFETLAA